MNTKKNMWAWEEIREDHLKNEEKKKGKGKKKEKI